MPSILLRYIQRTQPNPCPISVAYFPYLRARTARDSDSLTGYSDSHIPTGESRYYGLSSGIAQKGTFVTVVDFTTEKGEEAVSLSQKENLKFHAGLKTPSAIFVRCNVSNKGEVASAFEKHLKVYGSLDICINFAAIATSETFHKEKTNGSSSWKHAINVNLAAVIDCTHMAIKIMEAGKKPGVIINLGLASELHRMRTDPIFSGVQGGVVMFTRSLSSYKQKGIRVDVICPEFLEADMAEKVDSDQFIEGMRNNVFVDILIQGVFELISDESKVGSCLYITNHKGLEYQKAIIHSSTVYIPPSFEKVCTMQTSSDPEPQFS